MVEERELPVRNEEKVVALETRMDRVEQNMDHMTKDISDIKTRLLNRPTTGQSWAFAILSAIAAGCAGWAITVLNLIMEVRI